MLDAEIAALGQEPSAIALEPLLVAYLELHGPATTIDLAHEIEAEWLEASGTPLGGDLRPELKRALDQLAARGSVVQEGVFDVWRLARPSEATAEAAETEASVRRPSLSALLTQAGIVTDEQIQEALAEGEHTGEKLGEVVVRRGWAPEERLAALLAEQWGLQTVEAGALALDPLAVARLEPAKGAELGGFPVWFDEHGVVVAIAEPNEERFSAFRQLLGHVTFVVVTRSVLEELSDARSPRPSAAERIRGYTVDAGQSDVAQHEVSSTPIPAAPRSLEAQLYAIGAEVRELEQALDEARRTIDTRESEFAGLREANERHLITIRRLEQELADRSHRLDDLREKVVDLSAALEA